MAAQDCSKWCLKVVGVLMGHAHLAIPTCHTHLPTADSIANHPVVRAYILGEWATDHWVIAVARRLISSMFDISPPTDHLATAIARRSVAQGESNLVGMALYLCTYL